MMAEEQQQKNGNHQKQQNHQYIWLVRYGKTFPSLVENVGNYDSDLHHPEGFQHAKAIANRLCCDNQNSNNDTNIIPKHVYSDPFLRCMRTADIIVSKINEQVYCKGDESIKLKVEEGMTEWQVPSLLVDQDGNRTSPRSTEELQKEFPHNVDSSYKSLNPHGPDRTEGVVDDRQEEEGDVAPQFPETEQQLYERCQTTIRKILGDVGAQDSIAIVSHAPCCQSTALALLLEGTSTKSSSSETKLGPWSLGGITLFSRPVGSGDTKWTLRSYSDTSHMPDGEYKDGKLGQWSLPRFS